MTIEILFIFLLVLLNGVFSMSETALVSSRKLRLQQLAYLMVSTIPFEAMPKFSLQRGTQNTRLIVLVVMALGLIVVFPEWALFPVALIYILMQLSRAAYHFVRDEEEAAADVSVRKR